MTSSWRAAVFAAFVALGVAPMAFAQGAPPASSDPGDVPQLNTPAPEHKSIRVRVPAKAGDEKVNIAFEIVYVGKGHK